MGQQSPNRVQVAWISPGTHPEEARREPVRSAASGPQQAQPEDAPADAAIQSLQKGASPAPPVSPVIGDASDRCHSEPSPQLGSEQQLTSGEDAGQESLLHHQAPSAGESAGEAESESRADENDAASASEEMTWSDALAEILQPIAVDDDELARQHAVKQKKPAGNSKRNQPLTISEEDRFLLCLEYGLSIRQAASAIGCHHSTFVKRAKRDKEFARKIAHAKSKARTDPLWEVTLASRKSWRAAAWLLNYLERPDSRGKKQAS